MIRCISLREAACFLYIGLQQTMYIPRLELCKSNHRLINSRKTNNSRTHQLTNWKTHKLIHSNLKSLSFILQHRSNFRSVLAKIWVKKLVKSHCFYPLTPWGLSIFKPKTCILHHLAFLVWLPTHDFCSPKTLF